MTDMCNVCAQSPGQPVYVSNGDQSITSMSQIIAGKTEVFFCNECGHLQTTPLPNLNTYYEDQYRILLNSEEEDQLYRIDGERKVFRVQHQIDTLLRKIDLPNGARVLDYGCAKGAAARRLAKLRPDVSLHLFDVSRMYMPFWERFASPDQWATHQTPAAWAGSFDVIMSFFVMEHIVDPVTSLTAQAALLKPGGVIYFIVPNVYANSADLVVADHVNHFSRCSLDTLINRSGLRLDEIDDDAHDSAWVVTATKAAPNACSPCDTRPLHKQVEQMGRFWRELTDRIHDYEAAHNGDTQAAIYGSGFYGTFIACTLTKPERIRCFLDRNPYRHGRRLLDRPIIDPDEMDRSISAVYVGLNPSGAKQAIESVAGWQNRTHDYFYL